MCIDQRVTYACVVEKDHETQRSFRNGFKFKGRLRPTSFPVIIRRITRSFYETGPSTFHLSSSSPRVSVDQFPPFFSRLAFSLSSRVDLVGRFHLQLSLPRGKADRYQRISNALLYIYTCRIGDEARGGIRKKIALEHRSKRSFPDYASRSGCSVGNTNRQAGCRKTPMQSSKAAIKSIYSVRLHYFLRCRIAL